MYESNVVEHETLIVVFRRGGTTEIPEIMHLLKKLQMCIGWFYVRIYKADRQYLKGQGGQTIGR